MNRPEFWWSRGDNSKRKDRITVDSNWDNLRFFNALARHTTLSQAARELGVSHSTVQRRVSAFEKELQVQLFNHAASGYKLTPAGEVLYRETTTIQRTLLGLSSRITDTADAIQGNLSITTSDTIGHFIVPELIKNLQGLYPNISFTVCVDNRLSNIQELETDIAIRSGSKPGADLIGRQVGTLRFAVCASSDYMQTHALKKNTGAKTARHVITLDQGFAGAHFYKWLPQSPIDRHITQVNGFLSAYQHCRAGVGITLLPAYILQYDQTLIETGLPQIACRQFALDTESRRSPRFTTSESCKAIFISTNW